MRAALQQVAMFRIGGPLAASLPVLTLAVLPASTHAQEAPMSGDGAAVTPISLCVPPISKDDCPADHPIEGNKSGRQADRPIDPIYHVPGSRSYAVTDPEGCFATVEDAEAAGYRAPLR